MIKDFRIGGNRVLTHTVFWIVFLLANGFVWGYCFETTYFFGDSFRAELIDLPFLGAIVYTNLYFFLPRFFARKKYLTYLLLAAIAVSVTALVMRIVHVKLTDTLFPVSWDNKRIYDLYFIGRIVLLNIGPVLIVSTIIKLCQYWYYEQNAAQELLKEKLAAELNYLKAQVHPHFLFNTLNNLYSLTLTKSDQAPPVVLKLSGLMSYMLYDSQESRIALEKEIAHIRNYIDLEKIRYGKRLEVSFNVHGNTQNVYIPPLLLMPFVENAFKHGVSNETKEAWVTIDLKIKESSLVIKVENSKAAGIITENKFNYRNGIGLKNVKRRLALLYPGRHDLAVDDDREHYAVDLKLLLPENQLA